MNISSSQVESIVRKILSEVGSAPKASAGVPKTAKVAMLTGPKKIEVKEFPIPTVGDNDILVKVEGCGVCGTDAHEYKRDPFGLIPVALGHEGTGEIVKKYFGEYNDEKYQFMLKTMAKEDGEENFIAASILPFAYDSAKKQLKKVNFSK